MDSALLVMLIIIANLALYWLFFGKRKFEQKLADNALQCSPNKKSPEDQK